MSTCHQFDKPAVQSLFEKPAIQRIFYKRCAGFGGVPLEEPTVDYRRTMIPFYLNPGCSFGLSLQGYSDTCYWVLPDGTEQHGVAFPTFIAPQGQDASVVWLKAETGKAISDLAGFFYYGDSTTGRSPAVSINTQDLIYLTGSGYPSIFDFMGTYLRAIVKGDVKHLAGVFTAERLRYFYLYASNYTESVYGDVGDLGEIREFSGYITIYYCSRLYGSFSFADGCTGKILKLRDCYGFSSADTSQTIINWDASNGDSFARQFYCDTIKRSQLTAEGETATLSLIAKGCIFTFKAE